MKMFRVQHAARPGLAPLMAALLALVILGRAALLCAHPATSPPEPPSHRYLLIVDTSRAMQGHRAGWTELHVVEALCGLALSGESGATARAPL